MLELSNSFTRSSFFSCHVILQVDLQLLHNEPFITDVITLNNVSVYCSRCDYSCKRVASLELYRLHNISLVFRVRVARKKTWNAFRSEKKKKKKEKKRKKKRNKRNPMMKDLPFRPLLEPFIPVNWFCIVTPSIAIITGGEKAFCDLIMNKILQLLSAREIHAAPFCCWVCRASWKEILPYECTNFNEQTCGSVNWNDHWIGRNCNEFEWRWKKKWKVMLWKGMKGVVIGRKTI